MALSFEGSLMQPVLSIFVAALVFYPLRKYGSRVVELLNVSYVWNTMTILLLTFLSVNILIRPNKYETLYTNKVFLAYWGVLAMFTITLLLLTLIFYFIVSEMHKRSEILERNHILEMRESQYLKQQSYMEATAVERLNFRQTIRTLEELARNDDHEAIRKYLTEFVKIMPQNDVISFCGNNAVNALLNYYYNLARTAGIELLFAFCIIFRDGLNSRYSSE